MSTAHQKVDASHLCRDAYLYVRQSTPCQVRAAGAQVPAARGEACREIPHPREHGVRRAPTPA